MSYLGDNRLADFRFWPVKLLASYHDLLFSVNLLHHTNIIERSPTLSCALCVHGNALNKMSHFLSLLCGQMYKIPNQILKTISRMWE